MMGPHVRINLPTSSSEGGLSDRDWENGIRRHRRVKPSNLPLPGLNGPNGPRLGRSKYQASVCAQLQVLTSKSTALKHRPSPDQRAQGNFGGCRCQCVQMHTGQRTELIDRPEGQARIVEDVRFRAFALPTRPTARSGRPVSCFVAGAARPIRIRLVGVGDDECEDSEEL